MQTDNLPRPTAEYMENSNWIHDHIDELAAKYPNMWVAAHQKSVVAAGPGLIAVRKTAVSIAPEAEIAFHYVDDGSMIYGSFM